jgi:hypothetical protein
MPDLTPEALRFPGYQPEEIVRIAREVRKRITRRGVLMLNERVTRQVARKVYQCWGCHRPIAKGEWYWRSMTSGYLGQRVARMEHDKKCVK